MSEYDETTGLFRLSKYEMMRYVGKTIGREIDQSTIIGYCAALFREAGFHIHGIYPYSIDVVADEAQVRGVLSGRPSTFGHATPPAKQVYEAWLQRCLKESKERQASPATPAAPSRL